MHLRRWPSLTVPGKVVQWVLVTDRDERPAESEYLDPVLPLPPDNPRAAHPEGEIAPGVSARWERHSEGSSIALFADSLDTGELNALLEEMGDARFLRLLQRALFQRLHGAEYVVRLAALEVAV